MSSNVIILGGGGHARVVADALHRMQLNILGYLAPVKSDGMDSEYLGDDAAISNYPSSTRVLLANGLGSVRSQGVRSEIYSRFKDLGYDFVTIIHPSAVVAVGVELAEGCQIMAGAVIQPGVQCGENVIINTRAGVDHDCIIREHSHIAVGATLSGDVSIGSHAHIGAGSTVIQGVSIGARCVVGAGAVVIGDVEDEQTVVGVPARRIGK